MTSIRAALGQPVVALCIMAAGVVLASAIGPSLHRMLGGNAWLGLVLAWTVLAFAGSVVAARVASIWGLVVVLAAAGLMRLPMLLEAPYLSSDMYRYVWDGRVQRAGISPYLHVPAAPEVAHLRDQAIYTKINRADYAPTIYQPTAQLIFRAITALSDSVLGMKIGLLAFEAAAIAALVVILRQLALPTTHVAAYAWHPLPVWEIAGNGHVEAALLGLMMTSLALYLRGQTLVAGAVAAVAVLVKPTALLLFPIFWQRWNWKLPALLIGICALLYVPYLSAGWKVLGFLGGYVVEEELSTGGGFRYLAMVQSIIGPIAYGGQLYVMISAVILTALALRLGFRRDREAASAIAGYGLLVTVFLLLLTPHYPWYYLVLGPLLVFTRAVTPWVLMTGGFVLYDVIDGDSMLPFAMREGALHLLALAAFACDTLYHRTPALDRKTGAVTS